MSVHWGGRGPGHMGRRSAPSSSGISLGTHTVWRFTVNAMNSDTYVGIREWRFYDAGNNLISLAGATTSEGGAGSQGGHGASAPFDGNAGTYWLRNGAPSWVQITLPAAIAPSRMEFDCNSVTQAPIDFTVSGDGTDLFHAWEPSWDAAGATRSWPQDFSGGLVKAVILEISAGNGNRFHAANRLEAHATVSGANQFSGGQPWCNQSGDTGANAFDASDATVSFIDNLASPYPGRFWYAYATPKPAPAEFVLFSNSDNTRIPRDFRVLTSVDGVTANEVTVITRTGVSGVIPFTGTYTPP